LIHSFSVWILLMDLAQLAAAGGAKLVEKIKRFITLRDNKGVVLLNKDTEALENRSVPLAGIPELQAKSQEMICGVSRIPVVKYLGIQPAGLNASSEGELTVWGDYIRAQQEFFFRPHLQTVIDFIQLSKWGDIDEDITFGFEPLEEMDELQKAQIEKTKADTDAILANECGAIGPEDKPPRERPSACFS
jgi:phage-related protein (TIGR01555 family)